MLVASKFDLKQMNKQQDLQHRKELAKLGGGEGSHRKTTRQGKVNS